MGKCLCNLVEQWKCSHTNINLKDNSDVLHFLIFVSSTHTYFFPENYIQNSWGCTTTYSHIRHYFCMERLVVAPAPTKNAALSAVSNLNVARLKYNITFVHQYSVFI